MIPISFGYLSYKTPCVHTCREGRPVAGHHAVTGHLHDQSRFPLGHEHRPEDAGQLSQPRHHEEPRLLGRVPRHGGLQLLGLLCTDLTQRQLLKH